MRGQRCPGGNARAGMSGKTFLLFLQPDSFRRIDNLDIRSRACREVANRSRKGRRNLRAGAQTNGKAERRPQGMAGCNRAERNRSGLANGRAGAAPRNEPRTDGLKHAARRDAPDSGSERQIGTRIESWRGIHGTGRTPPPSRQRAPVLPHRTADRNCTGKIGNTVRKRLHGKLGGMGCKTRSSATGEIYEERSHVKNDKTSGGAESEKPGTAAGERCDGKIATEQGCTG